MTDRTIEIEDEKGLRSDADDAAEKTDTHDKPDGPIYNTKMNNKAIGQKLMELIAKEKPNHFKQFLCEIKEIETQNKINAKKQNQGKKFIKQLANLNKSKSNDVDLEYILSKEFYVNHDQYPLIVYAAAVDSYEMVELLLENKVKGANYATCVEI